MLLYSFYRQENEDPKSLSNFLETATQLVGSIAGFKSDGLTPVASLFRTTLD